MQYNHANLTSDRHTAHLIGCNDDKQHNFSPILDLQVSYSFDYK